MIWDILFLFGVFVVLRLCWLIFLSFLLSFWFILRILLWSLCMRVLIFVVRLLFWVMLFLIDWIMLMRLLLRSLVFCLVGVEDCLFLLFCRRCLICFVIGLLSLFCELGVKLWVMIVLVERFCVWINVNILFILVEEVMLESFWDILVRWLMRLFWFFLVFIFCIIFLSRIKEVVVLVDVFFVNDGVLIEFFLIELVKFLGEGIWGRW